MSAEAAQPPPYLTPEQTNHSSEHNPEVQRTSVTNKQEMQWAGNWPLLYVAPML